MTTHNTSRAGGWMANKVGIDQVPASALATGTHPVEDMEPIAATFAQAGERRAVAVARALVLLCIPAAAFQGSRRRWLATYVRMCALAWVVARDAIEERSVGAYARTVGCTRQRLEAQIDIFRELLAGEQPHALEHAIAAIRASAVPAARAQVVNTPSGNSCRFYKRNRVLPAVSAKRGSAERRQSTVRPAHESD